jgi:peptide chain release factor 1
VISDPNKLKKVAKEQADLADIVKAYGEYTQVCREIEELEQIIRDDEDPELVDIARQDLENGRKLRQPADRQGIAHGLRSGCRLAEGFCRRPRRDMP